MKKVIVAGILFALFAGNVFAAELKDYKVTKEQVVSMSNQEVVINMDKGGEIVLRFFVSDAPNTVANFIDLANKKFYDGLVFHRVIPGFVAQGGDPLGNGTGGPGYNIKAEFNKKPHLKGALAMARSMEPDSAGSQFYICLAPLPYLDGNYTVFGEVIKGMDIVDKIVAGDRMKSLKVREVKKGKPQNK